MKAILKNYRQSPRKMRLVADAVRGKSVSEARSILAFLPKVATTPILKLLESATSNAKENGKVDDVASLRIVTIFVDEGVTLKRFMPRARGSGARIRKRSSKVTLILREPTTNNSQPTTKSKAVKS
ncbi:MAG: 50S ribosomal protein L22 [Candidatus Taylorbacteria bacterium CG11_big_fil_rev_8_21_14_0_20_46_11]|uniref:Large ribosomal subunit protein uL22 n=1 Tax=Candidatus Taylorbacteria bacterium CG11_big_fil_rev_8_21_14_0_20_46_11 TaxID=1975025 RepID=A0A2H0KD16_9BACT|nr:MAG: 50S ribosomal protein L22 [Candidatus Taylorbacteria bacterium CG11_big_fil_rev_8_21_14_0_20_46_11]